MGLKKECVKLNIRLTLIIIPNSLYSLSSPSFPLWPHPVLPFPAFFLFQVPHQVPWTQQALSCLRIFVLAVLSACNALPPETQMSPSLTFSKRLKCHLVRIHCCAPHCPPLAFPTLQPWHRAGGPRGRVGRRSGRGDQRWTVSWRIIENFTGLTSQICQITYSLPSNFGKEVF